MWTLFWRTLSLSTSTRRKSYLPSSGSIQSHEMPVKTVFMWTLLASIGHTTFMRSVSEDTVLLSSPPSTRKGLPSTINCVAWPRLSRCGIAPTAGLLCARATRAREHSSNGQARNLTLNMFFSFQVSFHRNAPDVGAPRFAGGALHFEDGGVVPSGFVLVHGSLFGGRGAIAEVPFPCGDLTFGFVLEGHQAAIHIRHLIRPFRLDRFLELRFERHQPEAHQIAGIAEHGLFVGKVPEAHAIGRADVVVVDHSPGEADQLVLREDGFYGALRAIAGRVVEGRDPELQNQFAAFARLEVVVVRGVGVGQALDVLRATPGHGPVFIAGRREDVIILRVDPVRRPVGFSLTDPRIYGGPRLADRLGGPDIAVVDIDQGSAGEVGIHHYFEDVVVQVVAGEVPVIVVGFVEEVEAVEAFDPAHLDLDVQDR